MHEFQVFVYRDGELIDVYYVIAETAEAAARVDAEYDTDESLTFKVELL